MVFRSNTVRAFRDGTQKTIMAVIKKSVLWTEAGEKRLAGQTKRVQY